MVARVNLPGGAGDGDPTVVEDDGAAVANLLLKGRAAANVLTSHAGEIFCE